jgi:hypothetical protein
VEVDGAFAASADDAQRSGGGWHAVLGTGSPHAAKMYAKQGFVHLAGGLDGKKGYNPDDQGEWIMVRSAPPGNEGVRRTVFGAGCPASCSALPCLF